MQTSTDLTITISGAVTNVPTVPMHDVRTKIVTKGEVIGVSFASALLLLFLC